VPGDTNRRNDVFVRDRRTGRTERVSVSTGGDQSNDESDDPALSANGRFVAFESLASNLVPGDTNGVEDIFVRDRRTGTTRRVSLGPNGIQGNGASQDAALSATGRFVVFQSEASNLVPGDTNGVEDVFVHTR
jgi:Tol biopolymer transport system component